MPDTQLLIPTGINSRATGDHKKDLANLRRQIQKCQYIADRASLTAEIALVHQHMGDTKKATVLYEVALDDLCLVSDVVGVARVRRQLSSIFLDQGKFDEAFEYARRARSVIVNSGLRPNDLCNMTHGIIKVLLQKRANCNFSTWCSYSWQIGRWLIIEAKEVKKMYPREKSIAKNVWYTGFLSDLSRFMPLVTFPAKIYGYHLATKNGLSLRVRQFRFGS